MRLCIIGKYPPIQGGVSAQTYWTAHALARRGHEVHVVTNANEVEYGYRELLLEEDEVLLEKKYGEGSVKCHYTQTLAPRSYIPWSNPFVSKLFGLAISVLQEYHFDLVLGWYLEPYGLVATLIGRLTNTPVLLRHAGSDIGRLASHANLSRSYRWALSAADGVVASAHVDKLLIELGATKEKVILSRPYRLPPVFFASVKPLTLEAYQPRLSEWFHNYPLSDSMVKSLVSLAEQCEDSEALSIGVYGKVGEAKGTYNLLQVLRNLAQRGVDFRFIALASGSSYSLTKLCSQLFEDLALTGRSIVLPPLPPWKIPAFLKRCDIVCFLEHGFSIPFHTPSIPREVLSSGACFVCSAESAFKQGFAHNLVDDRNIVIVKDPQDVSELASRLEGLIQNSEQRTSIGKHGAYLSEWWEDDLPSENGVADAVEAFMHSGRISQ